MAGQKKFSHIVVGQADQDEVIYAGARAEEPVADPAPVAEPAATAPVAATAATEPRSQEYAEQTLEDLETEPMSGVQRGVLIAAAVFVIAFAVYWFVIRPMM